MKKFLTGLFLIILAVIGINAGLNATHFLTHSTKVLPASTVATRTNEVTTIPTVTPAFPQTLSIPKIKVNIPIESVGLDAKRAMDVPKNSDDAGWYDLGVRPGQVGNAVIDGHLDKVTGAPAAFWNIAKLIPGDQIIVTDANGKIYTYSVTNVIKYPYNNFPLNKVFGTTDKRMLNLISCNGVWDAVKHNYSQRTVVYSQLNEQ